MTPDYGLTTNLHQLGTDRHLVRDLADASFEHVVGTDVFGETVKGGGRVAGRQPNDGHLLRMKLAQVRDHFFGQSDGNEILARGVIARSVIQIAELADSERDPTPGGLRAQVFGCIRHTQQGDYSENHGQSDGDPKGAGVPWPGRPERRREWRRLWRMTGTAVRVRSEVAGFVRPGEHLLPPGVQFRFVRENPPLVFRRTRLQSPYGKGLGFFPALNSSLRLIQVVGNCLPTF